MFNWFNKEEGKEELSLEEKYEKLVYEKTKEALESGEYTYNGTYVIFNNENIPHIILVGREDFTGRDHLMTILVKGRLYKTTYYTPLYERIGEVRGLCYRFFRNAYEEAERIREEEIETERQAELLEKYNNLLGIKPLDEDLKQAIKKSEKLLNIAEKINTLRDEALKIKGEK